MRIANSLNIGGDRYRGVDLVPRMAGAGFDGLDFNFYDVYRRPEWRDPASAEAELEALARAASDAGVEWVQAHGPFVIGPADLSGDGGMMESCARSIRASGRLGAPWTVLHPFYFDGAWDRAHHERMLQANVGFFRALLPECKAAGVGVALENTYDPDRPHARVFGSLPEDLCEIVDSLDHDLIGICWDTGHAHLAKLDQRAGIASLGKRLKAVHIHDNDGRDDFHVLPFATAHMGIDWDAVTAGLAEAGYEGAFTLEVGTAFRGVPEELFGEMLRFSARVARHLADRVEKSRAR